MTTQRQLTQGFRLSPQQERIWGLRAKRPAFYRARCSVSLTGNLDIVRLEKAINAVVSRHEILRTSFHSLDTHSSLQIVDQDPEPLQLVPWVGGSPAQRRAFEQEVAAMRDEPFDVSDHAPHRWRLLRIDETNHVLKIEASMLCLDRISLINLIREIGERYNDAHGDGTDTMQYADFAEWQHELLESKDAEAGRAFWARQNLSQRVEPQLPLQRRVIVGSTFAPDAIVHQLKAAQVDELQQVSQALGISVRSFLFAAWQILIARLTNEREFLLAHRFEGRGYAELEQALGLFAKYAPLKCLTEGTETFSDVGRRVEAALARANEQQEYFDSRWFEKTTGKRDDDALFRFCFAYSEIPEAFSDRGVVFKIDSLSDELDQFEVLLSCNSAGSNLEFELHYDARLFSPPEAQRLVDQLDALIKSAVRDPDALVDQLNILGADEREQLLVRFNDTATVLAEDLVPQMFDGHVENNPDRIAVSFANEALTYSELNKRANQLAHRLVQIGVGHEGRVGLCLNRSLDLVVGVLAIMKAGGAYVPLDPTLPRERQAYMIRESGARIILTESTLRDRVPTDNAFVFCVDTEKEEIAAQSTEPLKTLIAPQNLAYVIFTSGSTGNPKGVAIEHCQLAHYVHAILARLNLPPHSSFATLSTISTDLGNTAVFPSLCSGGSLRIVPEEEAVSAEGLAEYFTRFPVDCLKIVPTHLSALLSTSQPAQLLPSKCLVLGGEACPSTLVQKIKSSSACAVFNHYGPTETTVGAITFEVTEGALNELPPQLPLGQPLPNTQIYILDKYFVPTPIGAAGEVYIGGSGVGRGYINRPDLTAERFVPDGFSNRLGGRLYRTGDRARFSATGEIEFLGRLDHQVKLHGHRIELPEVEAALVRQADVADAVVQISEDDSGNQHLVGWLVPSPERKIDPKTIREHLSQVLPEYMIPYHYVVLNKLPLSASGKIDRKALPAFKFDQSGDRFVAPRNPVEQALAEIWRKVLNLPQVGVFDNFFELGGDSIMSIQIIARANQAGLRLTPRQLFQYQTIAELAELVNESVASIAEQDLVTGVLPLTPVQHRFFEPASDWPHHYNQAVMLQAPVHTDAQLLAQVVDHLVIHHDALRLRFQRDADTWHQRIGANEENAVFSEIDLSSLTPSERTSTIEQAAARLQESLNLTDGPLVRAAYFNCGKDPGRLLIIVHHLAVDTVSWWILIEDLETAYHQLKGGHSIGLPLKTASFKAWAEQLSEFSGSAAIDEETNYWLNDARTKVRPLPIDCKRGRNDIASAQTISVKLSSAETRALLQEVPATYNTQINDALLAALVSACGDFTSNSELLIDLEGHGRETAFTEIDVSRTVGWFTTVFPVLLTRADAQPQEQLLRTKQELRAVPNHGQGYGLLRYMSPLSAALARLPAAEINFNYLGRLDPAGDRPKEFVRTNDPVGGLQPQAALRRYLLTVNGHILNDELKLNFTYSSNLHRRQTVELLANSYLDYLRALIATCSTPKNLTPADFPNARLDQKDLDKLLSQISHLSNAGQN